MQRQRQRRKADRREPVTRIYMYLNEDDDMDNPPYSRLYAKLTEKTVLDLLSQIDNGEETATLTGLFWQPDEDEEKDYVLSGVAGAYEPAKKSQRHRRSSSSRSDTYDKEEQPRRTQRQTSRSGRELYDDDEEDRPRRRRNR